MSESETTTTEQDRLTTAVVGGSVALGLAIAAAACVWSWPMQTVAGALQVLGIALAAFGLDVVRTSLQRAADTAIAAKHGVARWAAQRREQLHRWWLHRRGRPVTSALSGTATLASFSASGTVEVVRGRVDRDAISDRAWLAHLDDQVAGLWAHTTRAEENRAANRKELEECLAADHERLRAEIVRATRPRLGARRHRPHLLSDRHLRRDLGMSRELQRTVPVELPAPPPPALPPTPLARVPEAAGASDPYWRLVAAFLVGYPAHSSRAYLSNLKATRGVGAGANGSAERRSRRDGVATREVADNEVCSGASRLPDRANPWT